jgi:hypothetical protein
MVLRTTLAPLEMAAAGEPPATVTFDRPGVYPVQCTPHTGLGMVALVVVGDVDMNEFAAKAACVSGPAAKAWAKLGVLAGAAGRS